MSTHSAPLIYVALKEDPQPCFFSPDYIQTFATSTSILDSLFAVQSVKVCYTGYTSIITALLAAQKGSKERVEIGGEMRCCKFGGGVNSKVNVGNRHGKEIHRSLKRILLSPLNMWELFYATSPCLSMPLSACTTVCVSDRLSLNLSVFLCPAVSPL